MTNFIRTSWKLVATGIAVALVLAACGGTTPKKQTPLKVSGTFGSTAPAPCSAQQKPKPTTYGNVTLESYPTSCGQGKAIVSAYHKWLAVYNEVNSNPYGNGYTPRQELGLVYKEELNHTYKGTPLPAGCVLPTNITHAVSLPKACDSLVSPSSASAAATGPMAHTANLLRTVDTPAGVSQYLGIMNGWLSKGQYETGGVSRLHDAVVRQIVPKGQPIELVVPNPSQLPSAYTPPQPSTLPAEGATVWSCLAVHGSVFSPSGQHLSGTPPYLALHLFMEQVNSKWRVFSMGTIAVAKPISKGAPCGAEY